MDESQEILIENNLVRIESYFEQLYQDVKGKKLLSKNEKDKIKALNDFFHKQVETYNMFLGENGVEKILNGRKIGWTTFNEIDTIIEKQITPYLDISKDKITKKIKDIYGSKKEENEVLE